MRPILSLHTSSIILIAIICHLTTALITLDTIRNLTVTTNECRQRILDSGEVAVAGLLGPGGWEGEMAGVNGLRGGGGGQVVVGGGGGEGEKGEVEDTIAAVLHLLNSGLLVELEKPLDASTPTPVPEAQCPMIEKEYHAFLAATVRFLHVIHERQMKWHWKGDSGVFDGVSWMQGLWASRRTNSQDRSFIEQQMALCSGTGCFGKSKEVLRRDVEVVEYLNDLMDLFE